MRLKHEIQPACLRYLIYLQMEDAKWVSPSKVDPQVSILGSWKTDFLLSASSRRITGLWSLFCVLGGAGILPGNFHRKLSLFHIGECGYVAWEHVFLLDTWQSSLQAGLLYLTWSVNDFQFLPVPGSVRGTQRWGTLLCTIGWGMSCHHGQSGGFLCKVL